MGNSFVFLPKCGPISFFSLGKNGKSCRGLVSSVRFGGQAGRECVSILLPLQGERGTQGKGDKEIGDDDWESVPVTKWPDVNMFCIVVFCSSYHKTHSKCIIFTHKYLQGPAIYSCLVKLAY